MDKIPRTTKTLAAVVIILVGLTAGCDRGNSTSTPLQTIDWLSREGTGFTQFGSGGDYVYAASVHSGVMVVYRWDSQSLERHASLSFERQLDPSCTADGRAVSLLLGPGNNPAKSFLFRRLADGKTEAETKCQSGWNLLRMDPSSDADYVGVAMGEDIEAPPPGNRDFEHPRLRVGIVSPGKSEVTWISVLTGAFSHCDANICSVVPSNDGKLIAIGGWENGVVVVDVDTGKALWSGMPGSNAIHFVAFAPDGRTLYAGGTEGLVFVLESRTGMAIGQWYASKSGKEEYGHRITCVVVSPDGKWVAAGTEPSGLVFLGDTQAGKCVKVFDHGPSNIALVSFSPDSKVLASCTGANIKLWRISSP